MSDAFPQSLHERAWEGICAELLATRPPWDFKKAPSGPSAKIIEIGRLFAHAAELATEHPNRIFFRASLIDRLIDDELRPHRKRVRDLTAVGLEKAVKRVTKAITVGMQALVHFGLFETTSASGAYHLTDVGKKYFAVLSSRGAKTELHEASLVAESILALSDSKQRSVKIDDLKISLRKMLEEAGMDVLYFSGHGGAFASQKNWRGNSDRPVTLHKPCD